MVMVSRTTFDLMCKSLRTFDREVSCEACSTIKELVLISEYPYPSSRKTVLIMLIDHISCHVQSLLTEHRSHNISSSSSSSSSSVDNRSVVRLSGNDIDRLYIDVDSDIGIVLFELCYTMESIASTEIYFLTTGFTEDNESNHQRRHDNNEISVRNVVNSDTAMTEQYIAHYFQSWLDLMDCKPRKLLITSFDYWIALEDISLYLWYPVLKEHVMTRLLTIIINHCKYPDDSRHWSIATGMRILMMVMYDL